MKLYAILPILALSTGCSSLISIDPFVTEQEAVLDKGLTGVWQNAKGDATYVIREDHNGYSILYLSNNLPVRLHALVTRVGNAELLDLASEEEDAFQLPVHHLVRVWPEGTTLRWTFVDSEWMREQATRQAPARKLEDRTLLTAPAEIVHALMVRCGSDDRSFKDVETLTRIQ